MGFQSFFNVGCIQTKLFYDLSHVGRIGSLLFQKIMETDLIDVIVRVAIENVVCGS